MRLAVAALSVCHPDVSALTVHPTSFPSSEVPRPSTDYPPCLWLHPSEAQDSDIPSSAIAKAYA